MNRIFSLPAALLLGSWAANHASAQTAPELSLSTCGGQGNLLHIGVATTDNSLPLDGCVLFLAPAAPPVPITYQGVPLVFDPGLAVVRPMLPLAGSTPGAATCSTQYRWRWDALPAISGLPMGPWHLQALPLAVNAFLEPHRLSTGQVLQVGPPGSQQLRYLFRGGAPTFAIQSFDPCSGASQPVASITHGYPLLDTMETEISADRSLMCMSADGSGFGQYVRVIARLGQTDSYSFLPYNSQISAPAGHCRLMPGDGRVALMPVSRPNNVVCGGVTVDSLNADLVCYDTASGQPFASLPLDNDTQSCGQAVFHHVAPGWVTGKDAATGVVYAMVPMFQWSNSRRWDLHFFSLTASAANPPVMGITPLFSTSLTVGWSVLAPNTRWIPGTATVVVFAHDGSNQAAIVIDAATGRQSPYLARGAVGYDPTAISADSSQVVLSDRATFGGNVLLFDGRAPFTSAGSFAGNSLSLPNAAHLVALSGNRLLDWSGTRCGVEIIGWTGVGGQAQITSSALLSHAATGDPGWSLALRTSSSRQDELLARQIGPESVLFAANDTLLMLNTRTLTIGSLSPSGTLLRTGNAGGFGAIY